MSFCSNIFSSISYDLTGVSVTYKKNIGQWVAVQNRLVETRDSRSTRGGNSIIPGHMRPHACIRNCTPVDGHVRAHAKSNKLHKGVRWPNVKGFFLTSRPVPASFDPLNLKNVEKKGKNCKNLNTSRTERAF